MQHLSNNILKPEIGKLSALLQDVDYDSLPISEYNKKYIRNIKFHLAYHFEIHAVCLRKGLKDIGKPLSQITLVDYGGGCGFLSIFAKRLGFGRVVYIDLNPNSVHTIQTLKELTGMGPDVILQGNSGELKEWCRSNTIVPDLLVATDLIEHVYDLNPFVGDLASIGKMNMVFSTGSNPYNPIVKRRLRKYMTASDIGNMETPNYYTLRYQYIEERFPCLPPAQVADWATKTRGLIYSDIAKAIDQDIPPMLTDRHNTCDPCTGNWVERILPISAYRKIFALQGCKVAYINI